MSLLEEVPGLQREWTDRFVQVDGSIPELKRFAGLTGQVKTVNMSGQALVEFVGSEDIGWYDIHPQFLTVVEVEVPAESVDDTEATVEDAPAPAKETAEPAEEAAPAEEPPAVDTSNLSPLELARLQDSGGTAPAAAAPATSAEEEQTATEDAADDEPEEVASDDSPASNVEIPEAEGPERTAAILAACRAQDGG